MAITVAVLVALLVGLVFGFGLGRRNGIAAAQRELLRAQRRRDDLDL
jgi:hypothetical protein